MIVSVVHITWLQTRLTVRLIPVIRGVSGCSCLFNSATLLFMKTCSIVKAQQQAAVFFVFIRLLQQQGMPASGAMHQFKKWYIGKCMLSNRYRTGAFIEKAGYCPVWQKKEVALSCRTTSRIRYKKPR